MMPFITNAPFVQVERQEDETENCIARIAAGDRSALTVLYRQTNAAVYGFALSVLKNRQDAEDVIKIKVEFDSQNGVMVYEVEFETDTKEGEYEIHAVTGAILKSEMEERRSSDGPSGCISAVAAKEAALSHAGVTAEDVLGIEIEPDSDDHLTVYQVEFETGTKKYEYRINAVTGAVITWKAQDRKNPASQSSVPSGSNRISESEAKNAALAHAGVAENSTVYLKCYLEYEDGAPAYYCVEFKTNDTEYEYEIDLYSGTVLNYEAEKKNYYGSGASGSAAEQTNASYIGESAAAAAAMQDAGVTESEIREKHAELDHDGNTRIYKVEFETADREYEYRIDAVSGAILKSEKH